MPTSSAANSAAEGTPTMVSGTVTATVTTTNTIHRIINTSMRLLLPACKLMFITEYQGITW